MSDHVDILEGLTDSSPWRFQPPTASVLLVPVSGDAPPAIESVLQPLADFSGQDLQVQGAEPPEEEMGWFVGCSIDGLPSPIAIWCEPAGELAEHYDAVVGPGHAWTVAIQTQLSTQDPLTHYINLVRLIASSMPDTEAFLDPGSGHWLDRSLIEAAFLSDRYEPQEDVLWRIDVIESEAEPNTGNWIRTVGLGRCGRAELECIGVTPDQTPQAIELLSSLAALSLEIPLPGADMAMEIGPELRIRLIEAQDAATALEDEQLGSMKSRDVLDDPEALTAIVTDDVGEHQLHPKAALEAMTGEDVAIFHTERRTQQEAILAQDTWPMLLAGCRAMIEQGKDFECLVQVPFEQADGQQELREHLWLSIVSVTEETAEAVLVHEPRIVQGLEPGWNTTVTADEISGWILNGPHGRATPMDPTALHELLPDRQESP